MTDSFLETKRELYELMQRMRRDSFASPTPVGVTPAEARAMAAVCRVDRTGDEIRPGRVAELAHTTPSALSQTFKSLEEKGLIERHRASRDCRAVSVSLTEQGRALAAESRRMHDEHMDRVMAYVGEEDMRHFVRVLRKVVEFHEGEGRPCSSCHGEPGCSSEMGGSPCA